MAVLSKYMQQAAAATRLGKAPVEMPKKLDKSMSFRDYYKHSPVAFWLQIHNPTRMPFWSRVWEQQFENRQLLGLGWTGPFLTMALVALTGMYGPAPMDRADLSWMNSLRFRMRTAYINEGRRPAYEIEKVRGDIRYMYRGIDHNYTLNEKYDLLFKLRENYLIERHPGIQYPFVYRQFNKLSEQPDTFFARTYPTPQASPHFEHHGNGHH
ncbi:unnamed protein product [Vitrella brassicaformis CCMP3155]|uniref:Uncharacterized protein n=1 Tax=Vitrella brassicaformis (strain CCMP3155) TaxID=1169540 RepID=A0A0G4GAB4_VITBC|nr:unnamed protein product [Vitrella brassicaformis CCMP3155]|mmetsp:Transcript_2035/g.4549  ORF Transcript_2035/g.4549 Transcript_2035/m.4549 type:complete len:211 (-) Transcript_2035:238-870(-)|eukprot:CEM25916.1 unnamed protein product [Vitrella brassicaformis CCMP3155]